MASEAIGESGQGLMVQGPKGQFKGFELSPEGNGKTIKGFKGK